MSCDATSQSKSNRHALIAIASKPAHAAWPTFIRPSIHLPGWVGQAFHQDQEANHQFVDWQASEWASKQASTGIMVSSSVMLMKLARRKGSTQTESHHVGSIITATTTSWSTNQLHACTYTLQVSVYCQSSSVALRLARVESAADCCAQSLQESLNNNLISCRPTFFLPSWSS